MTGLLWIIVAALFALWVIGMIAKWTLSIVWALLVIAIVLALIGAVVSFITGRRVPHT